MIAMLTNRRRTFLTAILLVAHHVLSAATIINGGNVINQTWTPANSPYIIVGDVTVPAGTFLTIQAGVEVQCATADSQGAGRNVARVELTINGSLYVQGTALSPVRFKSQTASSAGSWYGIIITSLAATATLSHTVIQHAINGLVCESTEAASVQANNLTLSTNQTAIVINAGTSALSQLQAFANQTAINIGGSGRASVTHAAIYGNSVQAIQINSSSIFGVTLVNCTIHSNATYGVYLGSTSSAAVTIKNTIITGHTYGVYRSVSPGGSVATTYSDVWGNSVNFSNAAAGSGFISADPLYIDADGVDNVFGNADDNLRLQPNSPCGYGGQTGVDMGAYVIAKLVIYPPQFIGDDARIRFISIPNRIHQLQFTEDFSSWLPVGNGVLGTGAFLDQTNFGVRSLPKRFYRVRLDN